MKRPTQRLCRSTDSPIQSLERHRPLQPGTRGSPEHHRDLTPESFAFSFYDGPRVWEGELPKTLTYENTHMDHKRSFDQAGRPSDWMLEGLGKYVSDERENVIYACDAAWPGVFIPIIDESNAVYKQDLMHMYTLEQDFGLSYDYSPH